MMVRTPFSRIDIFSDIMAATVASRTMPNAKPARVMTTIMAKVTHNASTGQTKRSYAKRSEIRSKGPK